jgi:molybdenum cofactor cytidylyltransferase
VIAAVVLAAGLSRRMGRPKLLLDLGGAPVIRRTVERVLAAGLEEVVVVMPPDAPDIAAALDGLPVRYAVNPDPAAGQASSVVAGIRALGPRGARAAVALSDQPTVPPSPGARRGDGRHGRAIAAPVYAGERGNPLLFAPPCSPSCPCPGPRRAAGWARSRSGGAVGSIPRCLPTSTRRRTTLAEVRPAP